MKGKIPILVRHAGEWETASGRGIWFKHVFVLITFMRTTYKQSQPSFRKFLWSATNIELFKSRDGSVSFYILGYSIIEFA